MAVVFQRERVAGGGGGGRVVVYSGFFIDGYGLRTNFGVTLSRIPD